MRRIRRMVTGERGDKIRILKDSLEIDSPVITKKISISPYPNTTARNRSKRTISPSHQQATNPPPPLAASAVHSTRQRD